MRSTPKQLLTALALATTALAPAWALDPASLPFAEHRVALAELKPVQEPVLDEFGKTRAAELRQALRTQRPNFASRHIITRWGCGSGGCNTGAVIDANTGQAWPLPVILTSVDPLKPAFQNEDGQALHYQLGSRLIVFAGDLDTHHGDGKDSVQLYSFDEATGQFTFIKSMPYGRRAP